MSASNPRVYWQCAHCGYPMNKAKKDGRPQPGTCRKNNGKPHRWIKMREQ